MDLSLNNSYNARLRAILRDLDKMDLINKQPEMLGGGAERKYALSGNSGSYPEVEMLAELKAMGGSMCCGGRQNKVKKTGLAKALRTFGRAVKPLGKNLKPVKDALAERAVQEIEGPSMFAGRQNTVKKTGLAKALRTFGRAVKPVGKNLKPVKDALAERAVGEIMGAGKKRPKSARAMIVKKVMAEKGMGMIEASKYVKANGLY